MPRLQMILFTRSKRTNYYSFVVSPARPWDAVRHQLPKRHPPHARLRHARILTFAPTGRATKWVGGLDRIHRGCRDQVVAHQNSAGTQLSRTLTLQSHFSFIENRERYKISSILLFVKNSQQKSVGTAGNWGDADRVLGHLVIGNCSESITALTAKLRILSNLSSTFLARHSGIHNSAPAKILGRKVYWAMITLVT
jgi:hypothetical protein